MKKAKITILILFVGTLAAFFLISLIKPQKDFSDIENRALEQHPDIDLEDLLSGDYQKSYENYLNDQFIARDRWVDLAVDYEKLLGKKDVNGIYLGKDGYLLEKYSDGDFQKLQVENNIAILSEFINRISDTYGKEHVDCLMVPGKAAALPQKLPAYAKPFDEQEIITQIADNLEHPEELLDLTEAMLTHEDEYIYYRTDHHWTTLGAYYAYEAWCQKKNQEPLSQEDFEIEEVADDFYGTSYNKSHQKVKPDSIMFFHGKAEQKVHVNWNDGEQESDSWYKRSDLKGNDKYRAFFDGNTAKITVQTGTENKKTLLLLKDSYANCFVPFLAGYYNKIVMIDLRYNPDLIDDIIADCGDITDVMILYNVEKFLQDEHVDLLAEN